MAGGSDDFDLNAAWLRRSQSDAYAVVAALAARLEGALPERVTVERRRDGLLSNTSHVAKISVRGDKALYVLDVAKGQVSTLRVKQVRGVTLSSTPLKAADWLNQVRAEIEALAGDQGAASRAIYDFL